MNNLTNEQIKLLTPEILEVLKILNVKNDVVTFDTDILDMKNMIKQDFDVDKFEKLLIKYKDINFYVVRNDNLIFDVDGNYALYTQEDISKLIVTGVDINKISFNIGNVPKFVSLWKVYYYYNNYIKYSQDQTKQLSCLGIDIININNMHYEESKCYNNNNCINIKIHFTIKIMELSKKHKNLKFIDNDLTKLALQNLHLNS